MNVILKNIACLTLWIAALFAGVHVSAQTPPVVRRVTNTPEQSTNLHPVISGDGLRIAFESSFDLPNNSAARGFQTLVAKLSGENIIFSKIADSRSAFPALSQNGQHVVFASKDDPLRTNADGNSEIFYFDGEVLHQLTNTHPNSSARRTVDGNYHPSISDDGKLVAFTSNRDLLPEINADGSFEAFIYDVAGKKITQVTSTVEITNCERAEISGDGRSIAYILASASDGDDASENRKLRLQNISSGEVKFSHAARGLNLSHSRGLSDNGSRLAFSAADKTGVAQIYLYEEARQKITQITQLTGRGSDAAPSYAISGDGDRVAFATSRSVGKEKTDGGVEVYVYDLPAAELIKITDAPPGAAAQVALGFSDDGLRLIFNFSRLLSEPATAPEFADSCEIYLAEMSPGARSADNLSILNAASLLAAPDNALAPGMIAIARGSRLARESLYAERQADGDFPLHLAGTTVRVDGQSARIHHVSPSQVSFYIPENLSLGSHMVGVTNSYGFETRGVCKLEFSSPGIFTFNGEGTGAAIALDSEHLTQSATQPNVTDARWRQRISFFGTGFGLGREIILVANKRRFTAPADVAAVNGLPGLEQITFAIPQWLRGAGEVTIYLEVAGRLSNAVTFSIAAAARDCIVINEVLYDPPNGLAGDANRDGQRHSSADEFIEIYNASSADLSLAGWSISTKTLIGARETVVHKFPADTELPQGDALVVFGGGDLAAGHPFFGGSRVQKSSSGDLSLNNAAMTVVIRDATGALISDVTYGPDQASAANQSLTRSPDATGPFLPHLFVGDKTRRFSPGRRMDGSFFATRRGALSRVSLLSEITEIYAGQNVSLIAEAYDQYDRLLPGTSFVITTSDPQVVSIVSLETEMTGTSAAAIVRGLAPGAAKLTIVASENSITLASASISLQVFAQPKPSAHVPQPGELVINEAVTGFATSAAQVRQDFVELLNKTDRLLDISGLDVSFRPTGAGASASNFQLPGNLDSKTTLLPPRAYFLIVNGAQTYGATADFDASERGFDLNNTSGGIRISLNGVKLDGLVYQGGSSAPPDAFREFGEGAFFKFASGATNDLIRVPDGSDTGENASDYRRNGAASAVSAKAINPTTP